MCQKEVCHYALNIIYGGLFRGCADAAKRKRHGNVTKLRLICDKTIVKRLEIFFFSLFVLQVQHK